MSILDIAFPDAPRPGWPGRWTYLVRETAKVVLLAAFLTFLVWIVSVYVLTLGAA